MFALCISCQHKRCHAMYEKRSAPLTLLGIEIKWSMCFHCNVHRCEQKVNVCMCVLAWCYFSSLGNIYGKDSRRIVYVSPGYDLVGGTVFYWHSKLEMYVSRFSVINFLWSTFKLTCLWKLQQSRKYCFAIIYLLMATLKIVI